MNGPEFIVAIVAIACLTTLIKTWLDKKGKNSLDDETFDRLAKAFMQHKKEMQERVQNLETIVADEEQNVKNHYEQIEASGNENTLTNDLQSKDKVRS